MSYNKCLLPSLNSLKRKDVLILRDGEIKGMGNIFSFVLMEAHSTPLNMALVCIFIFKQLGIQLVFKSIHFHGSFNSFESIQRMHCHIPALLLVSTSLSQCCQVICPVVQCSNGTASAFNLFSYLTFL